MGCFKLYVSVLSDRIQDIQINDSVENDTINVEHLYYQFTKLDDLLKEYQKEPDQFADGITRLLQHLEQDSSRHHFENFAKTLPPIVA